jgi:hypothetical protein
VIEWQYASVRPLLAARADTLVWLRLPRALVMRRLIWRTLSRRVHRPPLGNGNIEPPRRTRFSDRDHIIRWGWRTHPERVVQVKQAIADNPHLQVVELRTQSEVDGWLAGLGH